jgi:hypothetical protein
MDLSAETGAVLKALQRLSVDPSSSIYFTVYAKVLVYIRMFAICLPRNRRGKNPKQPSFAKVSPDNRKGVVSQQGARQAEGIRQHVVNIRLLDRLPHGRTKAAVLVPALKSLLE